MTELTRGQFDRYLPDDASLRRRVDAIIGFSAGSDDHMAVRGLEWLGNMTEEAGEPWVSGETTSATFLSVTFNGLFYKRSWEEAVALDVPQGDWGWFASIGYGVNDLDVWGQSPAAAVARAVILMDLLVTDWLGDEPNLRGLGLSDMIEARIASGTWDTS